MATKQEFKDYMIQNKANLNQEALRGADMNMVYNEWRDTGSISKNYLNQPVTQQPVTQVTPQVQPNTQVTQQPNTQVQTQVEQQITPQVELKKAELPQTSVAKTMPVTEVKSWEVPTLETPKYQQQLDKFLETSDFSSARNKLKEWLANWTIDKATFDKAESYIWWKIQEQSQIWRDENSMFNALKTGQKIQSQFTNTSEAKKAQSRFDVANRYSSMSEEQLYNAYLNWEIGSQLEKDIADNPYLSIAKERFNKKLVTDNINKEANNILNAYNKWIGKDIVKKEEKTALETINDRMLTMFENMWKSENEILDFKSYMAQNYPDLVNETEELNAKNMQLKNLADERDARLDEIIKENPWISINRATMLASRQNKDINKQIQSMSYEIANLSANIQYKTSMADKEFGYALQQQSRQDQLAQEQRWYMFDFLKWEQTYQRGLEAEQRQREYQMEDRTYQEQQAQKELEQKYNYTYWDINSTNPQVQDIAIQNAVKSMYEKYPLPGMESQAIKVQKIKNKIAQGMTWTQAIQEVENEIRNSNRYKQLLASESAKLQPKATESWTKLNDWTLYNQTTWETKSVIPTADTTQTWTTYNPYVWTADTIQNDINRLWWDANLTWQMIEDVGSQYWINPYTLASFIRNDTSYGKNMYSKNNYGNVWNTDSLVASGKKWVEYATPQQWVEAVAQNLRKRVDAYKSVTWWQIPTVQELATWVTKDWKKFYWVYMTSKQWQQNVQSIFNQLNSKSPAVVLPKQATWTTWTWDIQIVWQLLKDNQNRWTWYSEADVEAFNDKIDRYVKNNDTDWMALAIRQNLLQDKDFKTEIDNVQKFKSWLTQVEKLISDYEKAWKSTNALKSMAEKIARKTWMTTDETLAKMQTQMWFVLADYIRSISWTAASDAEVQRLMWNMANLSNVSSLNKTILSQVKANAQAWLESMIDTRMYWLPESFKANAFKDIYWKTENTTPVNNTWMSIKPSSIDEIKKTFLNY